MNTKGQGQVVVGSSTSQLAFNLATAFAAVLGPGDNLVLQEASHEAVVGPWVRLAERTGSEVRWWRVDRSSGASPMSGLEAAVDGHTRMVVVTHVSNLLGEILDLAAVVRLVRDKAPAAQVLADGVAYAPHRAIDVAAWGIDWYVWSSYKVYGPHVAVMYGSRRAFEALLAVGGQGPNHYFVPPADLTYNFELGGASHEGCAGLLGLQDYLLHLLLGSKSRPDSGQAEDAAAPGVAGSGPSAPGAPEPATGLLRGVYVSRAQVEAAFALMTVMEQPLQEALLAGLAGHAAVRLVGPADASPAVRVPTFSFVHRSKSSAAVARELQAAGFAVRNGHMYARRLVEALAAEGGLLEAEAAAQQACNARATAGGASGGGGGSDGGGDVGGASGAGGDGDGQGGPPAARFDFERAVEDGVVRISLVHYNTPEEVAGLVEALGRVL